MSKKIGVLTLINSINYGGTLQAIALNHILKKWGSEVEFIDYGNDWSVWNSPIKTINDLQSYYKNLTPLVHVKIAFKAFLTLLSNVHYFSKKKKYIRYKTYVRTHVKLTQKCFQYEDLKQLPDFDTYIVGSDQVWNSRIMNSDSVDYAYLLEFTYPGATKISYAASTGGIKTDAEILDIINSTKSFSGISLREKSVCEQFNRLGRRDAISILDPTFLLDKDEWETYESKCQIPRDAIIVYCLSYSEKMKAVLDEFITSGKKVIDISPIPIKHRAICRHITVMTPGEFLYVIHNTQSILTDSFHGTVFSIIYHKQFIALLREGQEARVKDLLMELQLIERMDVATEKVVSSLDVPIDYSVVDRLLSNQRVKAFMYLKKYV